MTEVMENEVHWPKEPVTQAGSLPACRVCELAVFCLAGVISHISQCRRCGSVALFTPPESLSARNKGEKKLFVDSECLPFRCPCAEITKGSHATKKCGEWCARTEAEIRQGLGLD